MESFRGCSKRLNVPDLHCPLIPRFSDVVAVRIKNVCREGDSIVFVSAYMAYEEPIPLKLLKELIVFIENEPIIGADANAHHTIWGS